MSALYSAETVIAEKMHAIIDLAEQSILKTIIAENGLQFADHERVSKKMKVAFFFAHPYHSRE